MTNILIYTDFDGTVTNRAGGNTVFTPFYQSLLVGYQGVIQNYRTAAMENSEKVQSLFETKFGKYDENFNHSQCDADLLMSSDAVAFFHEALNNDNVTVYIVTKNRFEYIEELFKYHGFSQNEIEKLKIMDSGNKFIDVNSALQCQKDEASHLYILDDSADDYNEMMRAAHANNYQENQIYGDNKTPGTFEWSRYLKEILAFCSTNNANNEIDKSPIEEPVIEEQLHIQEPKAEKSSVANPNSSSPDLAAQQKAEKHQQFVASKMVQINHIIKKLEDKIGQVEQHSSSKAFITATDLLTQLKSASASYEANLNTSGFSVGAAAHQFKIQSKAAIDTAKPVLEQDLHWGDFLKNLLKTIYNTVAQSVTSNPGALFTLVRPNSLKAVEEAEKDLCATQNFSR